jgi:endonuclease/exonuclease/phosphatase family metal-dependent hydrolase
MNCCRLLALLESESADLSLLLGEPNEWPRGRRPLRWLGRHFAPESHPRTCPAGFPLFALDRIWVRLRAASINIHRHDSPTARVASDHLALTAERATERLQGSGHRVAKTNQQRKKAGK